MKRQWHTVTILLAMLMLAGILSIFAQVEPAQGRPALPAAAGCAPNANPNLVENPSFEGQYSAYVPPGGHPDCPSGVCNTAQMAPGWIPWWRSHNPADPGWIIRMPEWKPANPVFDDPPRVRSGDAAQQYFTFFSTHEAGFYQQVSVEAGATYCFDVWGHSWSAADDADAYSGPEDGILAQKVGIHPAGGVDWQSGEVIWGEARVQYDVYGRFAVTATAQAEVMTVFVYSQPAFAVKHNDVFWDDAALREVSPPLAIGPPGGFVHIADVDEPVLFAETFLIDYPGDPAPPWTAYLDPAGTLDVSLSATTGQAGDALTYFVNSAGYPLGSYSTTLYIETDPPLWPEPVAIPIRLLVWEDVVALYLPVAAR